MRQQHNARPLKADRRNGPKSKRPEDANPEDPGGLRLAGDPANTSVCNELVTMARNQTETSTRRIPARNSASSPCSRRPLKIVEKDGEFDFEVDDSSCPSAVHQTFGTLDPDLLSELFQQVIAALPRKLSGEPRDHNHVLAALHGIGPCDPLEGLLVVQMVTGHYLVMEFLKRAALPAQPTAGLDLYVSLITKLQRTFVAQVEALSRYRDKDSQKTNPGHVHVHDGAQAIMGQSSRQGSAHVSGGDHRESNRKST